eukprot:CAMPEP_0197075122 /NCGR_PEP_ID=MMETSP1384-20130603/211451_1 /TAXON_ID=29189 /ORGANISM="Ammonia sp." /LENGTH=229 /DNA_ID=CAMNT_0042513965 /DNA_START=796 /DNA_END=1485 /DNA_ORIENTATION=-
MAATTTTSKVSGKKRSIEEIDIDENGKQTSPKEEETVSFPKKRKIYVEQNFVYGIDTNEDLEAIGKEMDVLTKELSSDDEIKSKFVLLYNIDPVMEHCDIIDLCKDIAFPVDVNYRRGEIGKAWLEFETHQIALKIVQKLNHFECEERTLRAGLIEVIPIYVDVKKTLANYNVARTYAYPQVNKQERAYFPNRRRRRATKEETMATEQPQKESDDAAQEEIEEVIQVND